MSGQQLTRIGLVALVAYMLHPVLPAVSQPQQFASNFRSTTESALDRNANIEQLKEAPDLPQLPSYSGKLKFLRGYTQPTGKGWTVYHIKYLTQEDPAKVKGWYENALAMYQWKILNSAGQTITANHKDGHMCTLIFNPSTKPGYRTHLGMFFSQAPQSTQPQE
ncbi:MAG: hypothetical protein C5B53_09205 [Candidatus Melainabacteria bacterium]|nr:MAG: hypothetical protein C5B53_09205 [Candidatus Melainabacteria bacterium]